MDSLNDRMRTLGESLGMPEDARQVIAAGMDEVAAAGVAPGLPVGAEAPDLTLRDATGREARLGEVAPDGPLVVSFYRGSWCPYCSLELRALQETLPEIQALGGGIVAISPEKTEHTVALTEREELGFPVLADTHHEAGRAFRVVFTAPASVKDLYTETFGFDLSRQTADGSWDLPIPATFVLDADLVVRAAWVEADYTQRAEPDDIVAAVRAIGRPGAERTS